MGCLVALAGIAVLAQFDWRTFHMGRGEAETLMVADEAVILPIYFYVGVQFYHPERLAGVRDLLEETGCEAGASAWNGMLAVRLLAQVLHGG